MSIRNKGITLGEQEYACGASLSERNPVQSNGRTRCTECLMDMATAECLFCGNTKIDWIASIIKALLRFQGTVNESDEIG